MDTSQLSSSQVIDIMVVIDTDYVKDYMKKRNLSPSTKSDSPVPIDHIAKYMIVPSGNALLGQATGDLNLKARNGDRVSFREVQFIRIRMTQSLSTVFKSIREMKYLMVTPCITML